MRTTHTPTPERFPNLLINFIIPLPFNHKPSLDELRDINVTISLLANTCWSFMDVTMPDILVEEIKKYFKTPERLAEKFYSVYLSACKRYYSLFSSPLSNLPHSINLTALPNVEEELKKFPFKYYQYAWNKRKKLTHDILESKKPLTGYIMKDPSQLHVMFMLASSFNLLCWRTLIPLSNDKETRMVMVVLFHMTDYFYLTWIFHYSKFVNGEIPDLFPVTINEKPKNASKSTSQS